MSEPDPSFSSPVKPSVNKPTEAVLSRFRQIFLGFNRTVISGSWKVIVVACSGFALDYFLNLALSQWLNPADLGDYSVAVSVAVFVGMLCLLGTDQALLQYLPRYLHKKDWSHVKGILVYCFGLVMLTSSLVGVIGFVFLKSIMTEWGTHPLGLAFLAIPAVSLTLLSSKAIRGFNHILLASIPVNIALPLLVMTGGYLLVSRGSVSDWDLVGVYGVSFLIILVIQLLVLMTHLKGSILSAISHIESRKWSRAAIGLMLASALFMAMEHMGIYMCEILGREEDVAIYTVIIKHARFLLIIFVAVNLITMPLISPALHTNNKDRLQSLYGSAMHVVMWGGLIPLLVFVFEGKELLAAFGTDYEVGYSSLLILMAAYYLNFVCGFSVPFLQFSGNRQIVLVSITIALIVEIFLFILLVPAYGFNGAAWSMAVTLCTLSIWMTIQCRLRLGLRPFRLSQGEGIS